MLLNRQPRQKFLRLNHRQLRNRPRPARYRDQAHRRERQGDSLFPAYKTALRPFRSSRFLTFDTCHRAPRAVRTPRLLSAWEIPRKSEMPDRFDQRPGVCSELGRLSRLNITTDRGSFGAFRGLPSRTPWALRAASAALVRSPIKRRSFSASAA